MSKKLNLKTLNDQEIQKISSDLTVSQLASKYAFNSLPKYIYLYDTEENDLFIPFAYNSVAPRPERKNFSQTEIKFSGELRDEQKVVKKEAIDKLNTTGHVVIAAFPGFGKCLQKNTPIIMFNGKLKLVQDIKIGDKIMGDDSTPRHVLSTCIGKEPLFNIKTNQDSFGVNLSHILCLKMKGHKEIKYSEMFHKYVLTYFDAKLLEQKEVYFQDIQSSEQFSENISDIIEISVADYLRLNEKVKTAFRLYKTSLNFPYKDVEMDPYILGLWIGDRKNIGYSFFITHKEVLEYLKTFCKKEKLTILMRKDFYNIISLNKTIQNTFNDFINQFKLLIDKHIPTRYLTNSKEVRLKLLAGLIDARGYKTKQGYKIDLQNKKLVDEISYLALSLGFLLTKKEFQNYTEILIQGEKIVDIPLLIENKKFEYSLEVENLIEFTISPISDDDTYYGFTLDGNKRFVLGNFIVTHNTSISINISSKIGLKTLILCHRIILLEQWKESLKKFCPESKVQILNPKSKMGNADFYIMNAANVCKFNRDYFKDIGFLIVDECHLIMADKLSQCMKFILPRYLLGLSATPYRTDGLDILLDMYFGTEKISRKLYKKHIVYKYDTGIKPEVKLNRMGKIDWNSILDTQSTNKERNELIIRLVKFFPERIFLILCKRVIQANYLVERLTEEKEDVTSLIGSNQKFKQQSRILVGTIQKTGVGFDHPRLDSLILASDIEEYFIQYLGRVFRRQDSKPIIFDIVDNNPILYKHYKTRYSVYVEHGGEVKNFLKEFPNFK